MKNVRFVLSDHAHRRLAAMAALRGMKLRPFLKAMAEEVAENGPKLPDGPGILPGGTAVPQ